MKLVYKSVIIVREVQLWKIKSVGILSGKEVPFTHIKESKRVTAGPLLASTISHVSGHYSSISRTLTMES